MLKEQRPKFIEGAIEKDIPKKESEEVYDRLVQFGRYAFNKSHSVTYAMLAYRMAYLKTHYPHEFMAAMMTGEAGDLSKIYRYQSECVKLAEFLDVEINLLPLDINRSEKNFTVHGNDIGFGLVAVEQINDEAIDSILTARNRDGMFTSLQNFANRVDGTKVNEKVIENLISSGAFDNLSV